MEFKWINKQEWKYLAYAFLLAFVVFGLIIPFMINKGIEQSAPWLQFLIFNVGLFFFFQIFLKALADDKQIGIKTSFGLLLLFMGLDILAPPLMVSLKGTLLTGATLSASASDFIVADTLIKLGLSGFLVYFLTYVLVPFILLAVSAILLKDFVEEI